MTAPLPLVAWMEAPWPGAWVGAAVVVAAGALAGFVNVMAGGGSFLTVPALALLGLPLDVANGTNRVGVLVQSLAGVRDYARAGHARVADAPILVAIAAAGSLAGALVAARLPREWLRPLLLGALLLLCLVTTLRPEAMARPPGSVARTLSERPVAAGLGLFGAGLYGGFAQAGVGFLLLLVLGGLLGHELPTANALKLLCTLVYGGVSVVVFAVSDQVAWGPALLLALASYAGSRVGVRFALRAPHTWVRWLLFAAVLGTSVAALLQGA